MTGDQPRTASDDDLDGVLAAVGPRLRALRQQRGSTLAELSAATGASVSTLSRLESGQRKPTLKLLLPLARAHQVPLEELVGPPATGDPRVPAKPVVRGGITYVALSQRPDALQAYKLLVPPGVPAGEPDQKVHTGYDWIYVLSGRIRLVLGEHDLLLRAGEVAEFDTRTPHWFGNPGPAPAELLGLFGPSGERIHVRARPKAGR